MRIDAGVAGQVAVQDVFGLLHWVVFDRRLDTRLILQLISIDPCQLWIALIFVILSVFLGRQSLINGSLLNAVNISSLS